MNNYEEFKTRFKLLATKNKEVVINTLSNIFTMRLVGNKTHGDLAEIGVTEFINQFMYDFRSEHIGKDKFRAKEHEEDILIVNEVNNAEFFVSLKVYGHGPLQLSTDKSQTLFSFLQKQKIGKGTSNEKKIVEILNSKEFKNYKTINILPLIYEEKKRKCNIMVFDYSKAMRETKCIYFVNKNEKFSQTKKRVIGGRRKHPIFLLTNFAGDYICEIRYGGPSANALQRGLWTHTKRASPYFNSLTGGWISYSHNMTLVKLLQLALNSTEQAHKSTNEILQKDINRLKKVECPPTN